MHQRALLVALTLLTSTTFAQEVVPREYVENLRQGIKLHVEKKYEEALTYLARARRVYPQDWRGHTWQALTLINMANAEKDPRRREALLEEARAMQTPLIKQAGMLFQSPLRSYLNGLAASARRDAAGAYRDFRKAFVAPANLFEKYEPMQLRKHVRTGYALASLDLGVAVILQGQYEDANKFLSQADEHLPQDDPRRLVLHSNFAVVCEGLGQFGPAFKHIEKCIALSEKAGDKERATAYRASLALIHLHQKDTEKANEVLNKLPKDSRVPRVIQARCRTKLIETERDPSRLLETLAYYREMMKIYPEDDRMRLIVDYGELIVTYMGRRQAAEHETLLRDMIKMVDAERKDHPECPPLYWILSKTYALLGDEKQALAFERLHEKKKQEYETKHRFDARGRNRCAGA